MRSLIVWIALSMAHIPGVSSPKQWPRDIKTFAASAEACDHLSGEYDGELPVQQKREIERDVRKYCGAASRQLPKLRAKYKRDPAMLEVIDRHANEAVLSYR